MSPSVATRKIDAYPLHAVQREKLRAPTTAWDGSRRQQPPTLQARNPAGPWPACDAVSGIRRRLHPGRDQQTARVLGLVPDPPIPADRPQTARQRADNRRSRDARHHPGTARPAPSPNLINGRKRHVVVDTLGLLLAVMVTAADTGDRTAAQVLLARVTDTHHRLNLVWADCGYTGSLVEHCLAALALALAIVKRTDDIRGFVVLPKRWIVERFFAHLMRSRRLVRDFERRTTSAEAMIYWSMVPLMTRRLARPHSRRA
ncbi:transposase [Streptomyces sp. NPDC002133]|uniref:transposase n=1 Tax=Streptomyces sp. NPDC002133 TaxID=3154409 RepID=UPI00331A7885